jgi:FMN-dependent NADH-azoreductase
MKTILKVTSSARGNASNSTQLVNNIIKKLFVRYEVATVVERDLVSQKYPHLEESHLAAFFAPPEDNTQQTKEAIQHSDEAIHEIEQADIIVIGVPLYNLSIPSALKAWIDHIVRARKTFAYKNGMSEGLLKGKKVYIAIASGGVYSDGPLKSIDFVEPYLRTILNFIGLTDITVYRVEGVNIPGLQDTALENGIASVVI